MNFKKRKKILTAILVSLLMFIFSISGFSQSEKKRSAHDQERFEANAAAVAYINCKYEIAKYYSDSEPDDKKYSKELVDIRLLKLKFANLVAAKYFNPKELSEEFTKEVNSLNKELSTCVKYQNILIANEKLKDLK